ncbi:hypothetical protein [Sphingomonas sp. SORGH_AS_0879]|uniref:hypothetical protein n=1 Tax=Sphingomonas sp. SORGH_AS_0879 TaxID=3041790 RepID=UPI002788B7ED|nr:hypothetical protein [Sphingomonas sp. SORGH_AS_0879]MDQ1228604.1 hypothetical protein [Sphingomonas sp. SORGH_AS_0879]
MTAIIIPLLITLSALMPYLPGGVRVDQLAVPILTIPALFMARRQHAGPFIWGIPLIVSLIALAVSSRLSWQTGLATSGLFSMIRVTLPVVALLSFPALLSRTPNATLYSALSAAGCAGVASLAALGALASPRILTVMTLWVRTEDDSVWTQAQEIGRFSGIFNQPLEAGVFYSVALMALVFCWKYARVNKLLLVGLLVLIMAGGGLSLSKNFIVVGIVCSAALAIWIGVIPFWLVLAIALPTMLIVPPLFVRYNPDYVDSLVALYYTGGLFSALTAGRFGQADSQVSILFQSLFEVGDWPLGRGLGSHLPLDNGFLEFFYQGGIVALGGFVIALLALLIHGWRHRAMDQGRFLVMLILFTIGASLGGPAFTANRANIVLLLLIAATIVDIQRRQRPLALPVPRHAPSY